MSESLARSDTTRPAAEVAKQHHRRFSIGLRTSLVLVLVLGFVCHWVVSTIKRHQDVLALERAGCQVIYTWQWEKRDECGDLPPPPYPTVLTRHLPEDFFGEIVAVEQGGSKLSNEILVILARLRHLRELSH